MGGKEQNKKKRSLPQAGPGLKVEQTASEQVAAAPNATDKADLRVRKKPRKAQKDKAHVILAAGQEQSAPVPTQVQAPVLQQPVKIVGTRPGAICQGPLSLAELDQASQLLPFCSGYLAEAAACSMPQAANSPTAKRKGKKQKSKAQHKQDAQVKQKLASLSVAEQAAWLQHEYTSAGKATSLEAEALSGAASFVQVRAVRDCDRDSMITHCSCPIDLAAVAAALLEHDDCRRSALSKANCSLPG